MTRGTMRRVCVQEDCQITPSEPLRRVFKALFAFSSAFFANSLKVKALRLSPQHRQIFPTGRVSRRPPLLLHHPGPTLTGQPSTGHQHRPFSKSLIQAIQSGHQLAVVRLFVTFQIQLSLTNAVGLEIRQHHPRLRLVESWSEDGLHPCDCCGQNWPRLFEQHFPIFKWSLGKLQTTQSRLIGRSTREASQLSF